MLTVSSFCLVANASVVLVLVGRFNECGDMKVNDRVTNAYVQSGTGRTKSNILWNCFILLLKF